MIISGEAIHLTPWPVTYVVLTPFPPQSPLLWPYPQPSHFNNCTPYKKPYTSKCPTLSLPPNIFLYTSDSLWFSHITNTFIFFTEKIEVTRKELSQVPTTTVIHLLASPALICELSVLLPNASLTMSALDLVLLPYSRTSLLQLSMSLYH